MACILHIETSTALCSVAVSDDSHVIYHEEDRGDDGRKGASAERLGTMVDEAMSFTDSHAIPFDAVAVSAGPGSYTGLRIGVSMAKGICYGRDLKLIAVPTLELLCVPVLLREELPDDALLCPMLDARRMEVYAALYDRALKPVRQVQADVVDAQTYAPWLEQRPVYTLAMVPRSAWTLSVIQARHRPAHASWLTPTCWRASSLRPDGCSHWPSDGCSTARRRTWPTMSLSI